MTKRWLFAVLVVAALLLGVAPDLLATPQPWQLGMQEAATPGHERLDSLHHLLLWIITLITLFVLGLLVYAMVRFRKSAHPTPSRTAHHTGLEIAWTVIPALILVVIAIPSLRLLYYLDRAPNADMTIKVTGHQWYWNYEYPDHGGFAFDSRMVEYPGYERAAPPPANVNRLLDVDNRLVVPAETTIRVLVTSSTVMHSWFVPPASVQIYAVQGRSNETWMRFDRPGVYYGQCNQICGDRHAYMPIAIEVVPRAAFDRWVGEARQRFAADGQRPAVAAAGGAE